MVVHWVTITVCGFRDLRVVAVDRMSGAGDYMERTGLIRVKFSERTYMEDTLFHEVTHAAWDACGLGMMLHRKWGHLLTMAQLDDLEEDILVLQTPALLGTLKQAGWLTMPSPPSRETA